MKASILVAVISLGLASMADAGVTIRFAGKAKSAAEVPVVLSIATEFAQQRGWKAEEIPAADGKLPGLVLYPHNMSEPVWLQFGGDLVLRDSVKTQFAGAA